MDRPFSRGLKALFLIHAAIGFLAGIPLWLVPGRFLALVGYVPEMVALPESELSVPGQTFVDPAVVRLVGAAFMALALSSVQGYRAQRWDHVRLLVQMEAVFCALGTIGVAVTGLFLTERSLPSFAWLVAGVMAVFAVAWLLAWRNERVVSGGRR